MTKNTPNGAKKHRESTEPESRQTAKMFFFLSSSSSSSDGLIQICVTLSRWFSHKTAAFFTEQCTSPSLFSGFEVTRGDSNRSLKNYGFLYDAIYSSRVRMRTNHLATKYNYYARLLKLEILLVWGEVFEESLWFFSQYCIDGKLQLKHASAAKKKKVTWTRIKNIENVIRCRDSRSAKSIETR